MLTETTPDHDMGHGFSAWLKVNNYEGFNLFFSMHFRLPLVSLNINIDMAKIHTLKISNFRNFKNFEQVFGLTDFVCIIGRGDSGKTTILDAISKVLSSNWNLTFYDTDFNNGNIGQPIEIEASIFDLPKKLIQESKYGLYIRGLDKKTDEIHDTIEEHHEHVLTIRLIVEKDLEPKWFVVNDRESQEPIEIRANDRASLNVFLVSDYIDRHFSWNKGNPLFSLLKQEDNADENPNGIIDILREAKSKIDDIPFQHLDGVVKKIISSAADFGVDISATSTTIDSRDISIKDEKVCLHDGVIPFRLKGKGSKRIISIAIQIELAKMGGIILIDEIEQGLEPDRAQHLAKQLKLINKGQIFITTHSRDVIVELQAESLFKLKKDSSKLNPFDKTLQGCIRGNPEAFFSERVLVCEGLTEIGIFKGLNDYRISKGAKNATFQGVRFANGGGTTQFSYAKSFLNAGYEVCLFCDSDLKGTLEQKAELKKDGINIIDCEEGFSIELQLFKDLPWDGVKELIQYRITEKGEESVVNSIETKFKEKLPVDWIKTDTTKLRTALSMASKTKQNEWFKRIDHGELIASVCCKYLDDMKGKILKKEFDDLSNWIDNV